MKYLILIALLVSGCSKYNVTPEQKKYIRQECKKASDRIGIDIHTCIGRASREVYYRNVYTSTEAADRIARSTPE